MKTTSKLAFLLAASVFAGGAAQAQGNWPNWYVGLHGSLAFVPDTDVEDNPVVSTYSSDMGYSYGVSLGYRPATQNAFLRNARFELEWQKIDVAMDKVDSAFGSFEGRGTTVNNAVMGNVYYDFVMRDERGMPKPFIPYLGAGVGWSQVKLEDADVALGNINNDDDVIAYQFMAGVSYAPQLIPFTEWSLGYRYFDTANPEFAYIAGDKFSIDPTSHNLEAGVRFLF
jgi:opacity protein-like surface antigen